MSAKRKSNVSDADQSNQPLKKFKKLNAPSPYEDTNGHYGDYGDKSYVLPTPSRDPTSVEGGRDKSGAERSPVAKEYSTGPHDRATRHPERPSLSNLDQPPATATPAQHDFNSNEPFTTRIPQLATPYDNPNIRKFFQSRNIQVPASDFTNGASAHESHAVLRRLHDDSSLPPLPPLAANPFADAVFTHPSQTDSRVTYTSLSTARLDYERLEFEGDAILERLAVKLIFLCYWDRLDVGKQNRLREKLTCNATLADFARRYHFRDLIKCSRDLHQNKSESIWQKILADVFEAYVAGVVWSDMLEGENKVRDWIWALWIPLIEEIEDDRSELDLQGRGTNYKDVLQSLIGGSKGTKIEYREIQPMGYTKDKSVQVYTMACVVTGLGFDNEQVGIGKGQSKKEAGVAAAEAAVKRSESVNIMRQRKRVEVEEKKRRREAISDQEAPKREQGVSKNAANEGPQDQQRTHTRSSESNTTQTLRSKLATPVKPSPLRKLGA